MTGPTAVGIDVGGTRVKGVVLSGDQVVARTVLPLPPDFTSRFADVLAELIQDLKAQQLPVGVVVPGIIDDETGTVLQSANIGWSDLPFQAQLSNRLEVPVTVGHDVRAGLLAEHRLGAARGLSDVLFLPLGTGIASALMIDGAIVHHAPWAGEIGHIRVAAAGGRACGCGRSGCLETIVGGRGVAQQWQEITGEAGNAQDCALAARGGDARARAIWALVTSSLHDVLAPVAAVLGLQRIVLGGGLANSGDLLATPLQELLDVTLPPALRTEIRVSELRDWAGACGAALLTNPSSTLGSV